MHVHQQFPRVGVWQGEFQGAVGQQALALGGVPVFVCYPAGGVGGEVDDGGGGDGAGEDAVASFLVGIEFCGGDVDGSFGAEFGFVDAVQRKGAQGRLGWVPGVEVPVVAVVDQALRGDQALAFLLDRAGTVRGSRTQSWLY